jgi:uncharacterized membrane protein
VGSALVVGGFIGSFFTFGLSLGLSIAGGAISAAGAATATGASIAEWGITDTEIKKIKKKIEHDAELHAHLLQCIHQLSQSDKHLAKHATKRIQLSEEHSFSLMTLLTALSIGKGFDPKQHTPIIRPLRSSAAMLSTTTASVSTLARGS